MLDVTCNDTSDNKPGRTRWAIMSGRVNRLLTSGRTGGPTVTIITDRWVQAVGGGTDGNLIKLHGLALQAKARALTKRRHTDTVPPPPPPQLTAEQLAALGVRLPTPAPPVELSRRQRRKAAKDADAQAAGARKAATDARDAYIRAAYADCAGGSSGDTGPVGGGGRRPREHRQAHAPTAKGTGQSRRGAGQDRQGTGQGRHGTGSPSRFAEGARDIATVNLAVAGPEQGKSYGMTMYANGYIGDPKGGEHPVSRCLHLAVQDASTGTAFWNWVNDKDAFDGRLTVTIITDDWEYSRTIGAVVSSDRKRATTLHAWWVRVQARQGAH